MYKVPANLHIGNIGLAPEWDETVTSIPPLPTGGNMDNRCAAFS
jgi:acetamidase/formamidase